MVNVKARATCQKIIGRKFDHCGFTGCTPNAGSRELFEKVATCPAALVAHEPQHLELAE